MSLRVGLHTLAPHSDVSCEIGSWRSGELGDPGVQCSQCPWNKYSLLPWVFGPEEFHGQRSLVGYSPRGRKESDMTEQLSAEV